VLKLTGIHSTNQHDRPTKLASDTDGIAMPSTPAELFAFLDRLDIPYSTVSHALVYGRAIPRVARHNPGRAHQEPILKDKRGAYCLVVASEDAAIDMKDLHRRLGAKGRFSFGSADALRELLGWNLARLLPSPPSTTLPAKLRLCSTPLCWPMRF